MSVEQKNDTIYLDGYLPSASSENYTESVINSNITPDAFPVSPRWSQTYIGLISGALTVLALLLTCGIFVIKLRGRNKVALLQKHTALLCGSSSPGITLNVKDIKLPTPIVVNGTQSRLAGSLKSIKGRSNSIASYDTTLNRETIDPYSTGQRDINNEYEHCSVYAEKTYKLLFPDDRYTNCKTDYADVTEFNNETVALHQEQQDKDVTYDRTGQKPQTPYVHKTSKYGHGHSSKGHKVYESYYAATDILTVNFNFFLFLFFPQ